MADHINTKRLDCIDLAKAAAISAVLLIHCSANRFVLWDIGSSPWLWNTFWAVLGRWAVPLFLMCSGALMNDPNRELSIKKLFGKYILRLTLAFAVWASLYEIFRILLLWGSASPAALCIGAVKNLINSNTYYHLYYFYYVLLLYISLPMTRLLTTHGDDRTLLYILGTWLLLCCMFPFLLTMFPALQGQSNFFLWYRFSEILLCPCMGLLGWYLLRHPPKVFWKPLLLFILSFLTAFLLVWLRSSQAGTLDTLGLNGMGPLTILMAIGVFQMAQCRVAPLPRPLRLMGRASFCIYLSHPFFQAVTGQGFFESLHPLWSVPVQVILLLALCTLTYEILRRIPIVNRWLI